MEITYCGHSCFKIKGKDGMVVFIDPFKSEMVGTPLAKDVADVLVMTHQHEDHNAREVITGPAKRESTFVIEHEGEYEIAGTQFSVLRTFHDKNNGADRGKNLIVSVMMEGLNIVHLGDLGQKLPESQVEKLGNVDVLMIPVGGHFTIDAEEAMDLIKEIQPSYVIPMHYKTATSGEALSELDTLDKFLEKNKFPLTGEVVHRVKVDQASLPDDTQILVMNV